MYYRETDPLLPPNSSYPYSSLSTIENRGSLARDFYASERNFLSWLRLSLAILSASLATPSPYMLMVSAAIMVTSFVMFYSTQGQLGCGQSRPHKWTNVLLVSGTLAVAGPALATIGVAY